MKLSENTEILNQLTDLFLEQFTSPAELKTLSLLVLKEPPGNRGLSKVVEVNKNLYLKPLLNYLKKAEERVFTCPVVIDPSSDGMVIRNIVQNNTYHMLSILGTKLVV